MFCRVYTAAYLGIDGRIVQVEADLSNGLPSFRIVGEISGEVRESGARIRTAIKNSGYALPPKRAADGVIAVCACIIEWTSEGEQKEFFDFSM